MQVNRHILSKQHFHGQITWLEAHERLLVQLPSIWNISNSPVNFLLTEAFCRGKIPKEFGKRPSVRTTP